MAYMSTSKKGAVTHAWDILQTQFLKDKTTMPYLLNRRICLQTSN